MLGYFLHVSYGIVIRLLSACAIKETPFQFQYQSTCTYAMQVILYCIVFYFSICVSVTLLQKRCICCRG